MFKPSDSLPVHQEGQAAGQGGPRVLGGHQGDGRTPGGASGQAERDRDHRVEVAARNSMLACSKLNKNCLQKLHLLEVIGVMMISCLTAPHLNPHSTLHGGGCCDVFQSREKYNTKY